MKNLFKKVACFTDLHIGLKGNSTVHLQDCEDFVDWFIDQAKKEQCETCIFLGDWHHNRNTINLVTLNTSIRLLEKLGKSFSQFFWFPGNHDLFFKDKRDVHSSQFGKHIQGVTVVDNIFTEGDVTLVPWMVGEEWKRIEKTKSKYMFGHFELPLFYMNELVQMPDHGQLQLMHFKYQDYVFSGHFHKRQNQDKIWYIGNAFPHNFADAWDDDRGMMILEWGGKPEFRAWPDAPKFRTVKLSQLLEEKDRILSSKTYIRVGIDIDVSYEEINFLKETFSKDYNLREISLINRKPSLDGVEEDEMEPAFDGVDQIVIDEIIKIGSEKFDTKFLLDIYQNL